MHDTIDDAIVWEAATERLTAGSSLRVETLPGLGRQQLSARVLSRGAGSS